MPFRPEAAERLLNAALRGRERRHFWSRLVFSAQLPLGRLYVSSRVGRAMIKKALSAYGVVKATVSFYRRRRGVLHVWAWVRPRDDEGIPGKLIATEVAEDVSDRTGIPSKRIVLRVIVVKRSQP